MRRSTTNPACGGRGTSYGGRPAPSGGSGESAGSTTTGIVVVVVVVVLACGVGAVVWLREPLVEMR